MRFMTAVRVSLVILVCLSMPARADSYTILVLGDSISAAYGLNEDEGWVSLAEKTLQDEGHDVELVNASISGDTTDGGLRRLPAALDRFTPDLLIIELGGNDGLRAYPPDVMQDNLVSMASLAQARGADVLLLGMQIPANYGPAYRDLFNRAFHDAADESGASLLPFLLEPIARERSMFQRDGIHPSAEAQPLLADHVLPMIRSFVTGES